MSGPDTSLLLLTMMFVRPIPSPSISNTFNQFTCCQHVFILIFESLTTLSQLSHSPYVLPFMSKHDSTPTTSSVEPCIQTPTVHARYGGRRGEKEEYSWYVTYFFVPQVFACNDDSSATVVQLSNGVDCFSVATTPTVCRANR